MKSRNQSIVYQNSSLVFVENSINMVNSYLGQNIHLHRIVSYTTMCVNIYSFNNYGNPKKHPGQGGVKRIMGR